MPNFRGIAEQAADGCLVKPLLINFFQSDAPFRLKLDVARSGDRPPDDWFHASTHPLMTDRELYLYLTRSPDMAREPMGYVGKMSTFFGTIGHEVTRQALIQLKVVVPVPKGTCAACGLPQPSKCKEHGASDPATRSRGHLDAILDLRDQAGTYGFDLKSIYPMGLNKVPDMNLDFFIEKWPRHHAQANEYMRLTGLRRFIFLYMGMGNPWEWREFHIPFDPVLALRTEEKYRRVLEAVKNGRIIYA